MKKVQTIFDMGKILKGFVMGRHTKAYLEKQRKPQSGVYSDVDTLNDARKLTLLMKITSRKLQFRRRNMKAVDGRRCCLLQYNDGHPCNTAVQCCMNFSTTKTQEPSVLV